MMLFVTLAANPPLASVLRLTGLMLLSAWNFAGAEQPATDTPGATSSGIALHLEIRGAIGPATSHYIERGIERAKTDGARLIIIEMDTPGGLDASMRDINKAILASEIPVATFVSPKGSRAASAGTYILYASHIAAMSPATNLGAATPVQIGGAEQPTSPGEPDGTAGDNDKSKKDDQAGGKPSTAMERKSVNDAVAYIRGLADLRGRNGDWAERAVREAVSLTAEQAAEQNVIDLVAVDIAALLTAANGRTVRVQDREVRLATAGLTVERFEPDWRTKLLATLTDPNIAYFLLLIGIYGLIFEGYNPGAVVPGVVGAISLLLALFAFQVLPVNFAGLGLILLGVALLVAEAFVPSFGVLGIGGVIAFVFGSVLLLDTDVPGFAISRGLIGTAGLTAAAGLLGLMMLVARNRRRPVVSGVEGMTGAIAEVLEDFDGEGPVFVRGERWNATTTTPLRKGERVRIAAVSGLVLRVEPFGAANRSTMNNPI